MENQGLELNNVLPLKFYLCQNYPNPFKDFTFIKYCIGFRSHVIVDLFNSLGKKVKTIVDEIKQTGVYEIEFKPDDLPEGEYLYRLKTFKEVINKPDSGIFYDFVDTKYMLLKK